MLTTRRATVVAVALAVLIRQRCRGFMAKVRGRIPRDANRGGDSERLAHKAVERGCIGACSARITLYPFPADAPVELSRRVTRILLVAMNAEQRVPDLRLAVDRRVPAKPFGRMGGMLTSPEEIWENLGRMTQEPLAEH